MGDPVPPQQALGRTTEAGSERSMFKEFAGQFFIYR
jgi:hypothetical protein